jgi:hypothetical protein
MICPHCKGNGYLKLCFEAENIIEQCWVCNSTGEADESKHFHQTWEEGEDNNEFRTQYYGPLLDSESFKNYKLEKNE